MRIQICSDIHLELRENPYAVTPKAHILALLGDIGNPWKTDYADFIKIQSHNFEQVWILAGNHEFYGNEIDQTFEHMNLLASKFNNVKIFNRTEINYQGLRVLGCTLWSQIKVQHQQLIFQRLNDFKQIRHGKDLLNLQSYQKLFENDWNWLDHQLQNSKVPTLVLTHHAPIIRSGHPKFHGTPLTSAFANDLEAYLHPPIKAWCFGHTHWPVDVCYGQTQVKSAPVGYEKERLPSLEESSLVEI